MKNFIFDPSEEMQWQDPEFRAKVNLEFLAFFIFPNEKLCSEKHYSIPYKNFLLENFQLSVNVYPIQAYKINRWFLTEDRELNQEWNSKVKFFELMKKMNFYPDQKLVTNLDDLRAMIEKYQAVYAKSEFGFAGIGNKVLKIPLSENEEKWCVKNFGRGVVVEPFYDKKFDFSLFIKEDQEFFYDNRVSIDGRYLSTRYDRHRKLETFLIERKVSSIKVVEFQNLKSQLLKSLPADLIKLGLVVDCFIYEFKNDFFVHISEISFRWTMGRSMLQIIDNLNLSGEAFEFFSEDNIHLKQADKFFQMAYKSLNEEEIVVLSDEFNQKTYKIKKIR